MSVLWRRSGAVERDSNDVRAIAAVVEFFVGGTDTPLSVYNDANEDVPATTDVNGNIVADGAGRWPTIFIPFVASYRERARTAGGTTLWDIDNIPNPDPVEASEDSVDETQLLQTNDWVFSPVDETRTGFVRANGRTMGSASSGGTERANADTEDLFLRLWNTLANDQAAVSGGRGASAAADWAANKSIALPDCRGGVPRGLDDMGNSAASRFGNTPFTNGDAITQGSVAGLNEHLLSNSQIEAHTHGLGTMAVVSDGSHTHTVTGNTGSEGSHTHTGTTSGGSAHNHTGNVLATETFSSNVTAGATVIWRHSGSVNEAVVSLGTESAHTHTFTSNAGSSHLHSISLTSSSNGAHTHALTGATSPAGGGLAHNNVSRSILGTWYIKL